MKTTAIFTRTLTTSTVPAFDLVRQGWQIQSIDINGVITATKQQIVNCDKKAAESNMMLHNLYDSKKKYGTEIVSKIDFGVYKVGLVWNTDTHCAEAWMHHPEVNKECSKGLMFVSNGDGTCSVFKIGTCTDTNVEIPSVYDGEIVTSIYAYAFEGCTGLTSVTIPDSVVSIGRWAFYGCTGLTSVTIPDSVTSIGSSAFYGCTGLTSVTIPDSVVSIGEGAFEGCSRLKSITLPFVGASFNETSHTHFGYIFGALSDCLNSSYVPASLKTVAITGGLSIGEYAFSDCYGLTSITIPDSVTSIGEGAFRYCPRLTSITIPDSVTNIGSRAFFGCYGLTSIKIPNSVTNIGDYVFSYCDNLKNIIMGDNISSKL